MLSVIHEPNCGSFNTYRWCKADPYAGLKHLYTLRKLSVIVDYVHPPIHTHVGSHIRSEIIIAIHSKQTASHTVGSYIRSELADYMQHMPVRKV